MVQFRKKKSAEKQWLPFKLLIVGNGYGFDEHWVLWRLRSEAKLGLKIINLEISGRKGWKVTRLIRDESLPDMELWNKQRRELFFMWRAASLTQ